ncbi:MAG: Uma2 family endonuclease [Leptolyngbyaceae cyanobacterium SL_5_9]|nr:Uma2 family endonuclease [Leptolyngbyaceae cyanobacterium SL_5_9]NJO72810.1 Uma2 family endonuclease [Leptolyngbyaceae cyanobacterium RM1_406_9]
MIANSGFPRMSPQEYLVWEESQPLRYEYLHGEVVAMTGGTIPHNQVAVNLASVLKAHLRGKGCKVLTSDAKIAVSEQGPFHYADVSVTCDERDRAARQFIRYPCLVAEVLSPSTEAVDRGEKFRQYRRIETLREYLLIDPDRPSVECYRLNERGNWELFQFAIEDSDAETEACEVELTSVRLTFPLSLLYEDVERLS